MMVVTDILFEDVIRVKFQVLGVKRTKSGIGPLKLEIFNLQLYLFALRFSIKKPFFHSGENYIHAEKITGRRHPVLFLS